MISRSQKLRLYCDIGRIQIVVDIVHVLVYTIFEYVRSFDENDIKYLR